MEQTMDSIQNAYDALLNSISSLIETENTPNVQPTIQWENAVENFIQSWQLFHVACDQAQEFMESIRQRIGSECLVDEATGSLAARTQNDGRPYLPPLSAVRLEQMSKAIRWLVLELQHGSTTSGGGQSHLPTGIITSSATEGRPGEAAIQ